MSYQPEMPLDGQTQTRVRNREDLITESNDVAAMVGVDFKLNLVATI